MDLQVTIFGRSVERARLIAALLLLVALLLMVGGVALGGPIGTVLAAIGSTMATTALVSFLYDPFLKEILAQEIFTRVGLRDNIVRTGLEDLANSALEIGPGIQGSRSLEVMPLDPFSWARESFPAVVSAAKDRAMEVVIVLPSPDPGPSGTILASRLRLGEQDVEHRLRDLPEELASAWDRAQIGPESTLKVVTHEHSVATGLLVCDRMVVIETGPSLYESSTDDTRLVQQFRRDAPLGQWADRQISEAIASAPAATVRPVTAAADLPTGRTSEAACSVEVPLVEPPSIPVPAKSSNKHKDS